MARRSGRSWWSSHGQAAVPPPTGLAVFVDDNRNRKRDEYGGRSPDTAVGGAGFTPRHPALKVLSRRQADQGSSGPFISQYRRFRLRTDVSNTDGVLQAGEISDTKLPPAGGPGFVGRVWRIGDPCLVAQRPQSLRDNIDIGDRHVVGGNRSPDYLKAFVRAVGDFV